ncbi:MAG: thiamine phosphate synthase, partial [Edaphobacter sp.]
ASDIAALAREILETIAAISVVTKLLINSRADIALAIGAHGVHLTSSPEELTPTQIRILYARVSLTAPIVTTSCHSLNEVQRAREDHADAILFGPVFEKTVAGQSVNSGQGLDRLRAACMAASPVPVYALGGVTLTNASACTDAGAAGIAGIRLFHNLVR